MSGIFEPPMAEVAGWPGATPPLFLSALTLRSASFADRIPAAGKAGFAGIGMGAADYLDARRSGFSETDIGEYVAAHGLRVVELEFLRDWWADPDTRGMRLEEDILFHLAGLLGAEQINVGLFDVVPSDVVHRAFRRLCSRADDHGLRIGLEFMPYSALRTLSGARDLVSRARDAGLENAGLILDAWHWHRAGADLDELAALDASQVFAVQLNDALPEAMADLREEGRHARLLPGDGVIDLAAFLGTLAEAGVTAPLAVEVLSDDLEAHSPVQACKLAAVTTRRALAGVAQSRLPVSTPA